MLYYETNKQIIKITRSGRRYCFPNGSRAVLGHRQDHFFNSTAKLITYGAVHLKS